GPSRRRSSGCSRSYLHCRIGRGLAAGKTAGGPGWSATVLTGSAEGLLPSTQGLDTLPKDARNARARASRLGRGAAEQDVGREVGALPREVGRPGSLEVVLRTSIDGQGQTAVPARDQVVGLGADRQLHACGGVAGEGDRVARVVDLAVA